MQHLLIGVVVHVHVSLLLVKKVFPEAFWPKEGAQVAELPACGGLILLNPGFTQFVGGADRRTGPASKCAFW